MAKPKRKKKKPGSGYATPILDTGPLLAEAEALLPALEDGGGAEWGDVQRLLIKAKGAPDEIARAVVSRNPATLAALIEAIRNPEVAESEPEPIDMPEIPAETLREAMKAYRKRMKLTKLDHESKLGRNPLTSGKDAAFDSILPPHQYPAEVWQALVANGELVSSGLGFYRFPDKRKEF
jgi:hypothetical protein